MAPESWAVLDAESAKPQEKAKAASNKDTETTINLARFFILVNLLKLHSIVMSTFSRDATV